MKSSKFKISFASEKYRSLIISIAILLILVGLLLAFTFFAASILERNTSTINATNRVANNSQEIIKDLFDMQNSAGEDISSPHMQTVFKRLQENIAENDALLNALENGANIEYIDSEHTDTIYVPKLADSYQDDITAVKQQWTALKPLAENYVNEAQDIMKDASVSLYLATTQAKISSLVMSDSLNELSNQVYDDARNTATVIRAVQLGGVVVILIYFAAFLAIFMRRLNETDRIAEEARSETAEIMRTVNSGLFLLDKDLTIGNQYSNALTEIVGATDLAGESLNSILRSRVSDKDLQTAQEFIGQLYNPRVKEKLVESLNPLHKVMFYDPSNPNKERYLDFKFSRVYDGKDISRILVNVNDVSESVKLEQRLEKERAENDRQIEMLTTILNVQPAVMNDFIVSARQRIDKMNDILKNRGSSQFELEAKLKALYREMHSLKGESSALRLHSFTKIASNAEDKLYALQNQGKLLGNDFLPLTVQLDELLSLASTIKNLNDKINSVQAGVGSILYDEDMSTEVITMANETPDVNQVVASNISQAATSKLGANELAQYLVQFGRDIAQRQNKEIEVDVTSLQNAVIPDSLSVITKEVCVQLLRNAIVHGIADAETRIKNGKSPKGRVAISIQDFGAEEDSFMLIVEDDGQGIDYDAIRQKLIDSGQSADVVNGLDKNKLLSVLFSSGFSTKKYVDEDGGRGIGLDITKERIKEYGGKINVQSEKGKFSRFVIKLPIPKV